MHLCVCVHAPIQAFGINSYMQGVCLCVCECVHMCERVTTEPTLMASLRPVAAAVQIEWSPGVIALTEGVFCIQPPYVGQAGCGALYSQVQDGFGLFNFLLLFFLWREVKWRDFHQRLKRDISR